MDKLTSIVSQKEQDLYNIIFKFILPIPLVHESTNRRSNINDDLDPGATTDEYPPIERFLWAGSKREGFTVPITSIKPNDLAYLMSDYDLIAILRGFIAKDDVTETTELPHSEQLHIKESFHPGYVTLVSDKDHTSFSTKFDDDCSGKVHFCCNKIEKKTIDIPVDEIVDKRILPLTKCTEKFVHGPALCYKIKSEHPGTGSEKVLTGSEVDIVLAVRVSSWPKAAENWAKRHRKHNWPSEDLRQRIISSAIHLVPVGHPESSEMDTEWRYSFTIPERLLAQSLNLVQRTCYVLAKILLKAVMKDNEYISSYFLKTSMFWLCEEVPHAEWRADDKIGSYVLLLLHRLQSFLKSKELKHYFIPENNMIDHIPSSSLDNAIEKLSSCIQDPLPIMFQFMGSNKYFGFYVNPPQELFKPLIDICRSQQDGVDTGLLYSTIRCLLWDFIGLYASWLKKEIRPPGDFITRPFAELKFRLMFVIAKELKNLDEKKNMDEIIKSIAERIEEYNVKNASEFLTYINEKKGYLQSLFINE